MSTKEKLIERFKAQPADFTFNELVRLFSQFGYEQFSKGKTAGSRVKLVNKEKKLSYNIHKPHPDKYIKGYVMRQVLEYLTENKFINK